MLVLLQLGSLFLSMDLRRVFLVVHVVSVKGIPCHNSFARLDPT